MHNQGDFIFLETHENELFEIRSYIIEEINGNNTNRRKLNRAITNLRLQYGKIINQKLKMERNSEKILNHKSILRKQKRKAIKFVFADILTFIADLGLLSTNQETLLLDILMYILLILTVALIAGTIYSTVKLDKTYNNIVKQYILESFKNK
jgi:hypothetical protein